MATAFFLNIELEVIGEEREKWRKEDKQNDEPQEETMWEPYLIVVNNLFLTLFFLPLAPTHLVPAFVVYFPIAVLILFFAVMSDVWIYEKRIFPGPGSKHTVRQRLMYVPMRALVYAWKITCIMIFLTMLPTWAAIFYSNLSWGGVLSQDWKSRDTGRFFECLKPQFQSVTGSVDVIGLVF